MKIPNWAVSHELEVAIEKNPLPDGIEAEWEDWRLVLEGKEYPPKYPTYEDWLEKYSPETLDAFAERQLSRMGLLDDVYFPWEEPF